MSIPTVCYGTSVPLEIHLLESRVFSISFRMETFWWVYLVEMREMTGMWRWDRMLGMIKRQDRFCSQLGMFGIESGIHGQKQSSQRQNHSPSRVCLVCGPASFPARPSSPLADLTSNFKLFLTHFALADLSYKEHWTQEICIHTLILWVSCSVSFCFLRWNGASAIMVPWW